MNKFLGKQIMVELYGCNSDKINDQSFISGSMTEAAIKAKATIVKKYFHEFSPYGISGTIVIAESHINIHTWPEHNYAAIDIFTCGEDLLPLAAAEHLKSEFEADKMETTECTRGSMDAIKKLRETQSQYHHP